jgi:hypothetical protein
MVVGTLCLFYWFVFRGAYERGTRRKFKNPRHAEFELAIAPWIMLFILALGVIAILASVLADLLQA